MLIDSFRNLWIKGAPEVLLSRCTTILQKDGSITNLSLADRRAIENIKDCWSSQGKRVILMAQKVISEDIESILKSSRAEKHVTEMARGDLTLIGLWGLIDPIVGSHTPSLLRKSLQMANINGRETRFPV